MPKPKVTAPLDLGAMPGKERRAIVQAYQEAHEYLSHNVLGAFVADPMPLYLERVDHL